VVYRHARLVTSRRARYSKAILTRANPEHKMVRLAKTTTKHSEEKETTKRVEKKKEREQAPFTLA